MNQRKVTVIDLTEVVTPPPKKSIVDLTLSPYNYDEYHEYQKFISLRRHDTPQQDTQFQHFEDVINEFRAFDAKSPIWRYHTEIDRVRSDVLCKLYVLLLHSLPFH
jgi:hypothetical protein